MANLKSKFHNLWYNDKCRWYRYGAISGNFIKSVSIGLYWPENRSATHWYNSAVYATKVVVKFVSNCQCTKISCTQMRRWHRRLSVNIRPNAAKYKWLKSAGLAVRQIVVWYMHSCSAQMIDWVVHPCQYIIYTPTRLEGEGKGHRSSDVCLSRVASY